MTQRAIGHIIRQRRIELGITQDELAERVSAEGEWLRQSDISRIESGHVKLPRPERLQRIADVLGLSLGDLLLYATGVDEEGRFLTSFDGESAGKEEPACCEGQGPLWEAPDIHRQLLEGIDHAVVVTDVEGAIRYWNASAEQLFGWSSEEVVGRNAITTLVDSTWDWQEQAASIRLHLTAGQHWNGEFLVRQRDGCRIRVAAMISPVLDRDENVFAIFSAVHAI